HRRHSRTIPQTEGPGPAEREIELAGKAPRPKRPDGRINVNSDDIAAAHSSGTGDEDEDDAPIFDTSVAHQARLYDYLLGGKDNFAADRAFARAIIEASPRIVATARANRALLGRTIRFLAGEADVAQFLDIGTGIPSAGSTHQVAQEVRPDAKIVYVDNDPVVLAHARALLTGHSPGTTNYIDADLRDPESILSQARKTLDFNRPVGVLLLAILHAISDTDDPHRIVATIMNAMPSGSYLAITHVGLDLFSPDEKAKVESITRDMSHDQYTYRNKAEVTRFFDGLGLVEPGIVPVGEWRPDQEALAYGSTYWYAGLARKS
ncbi:MAG: SAM-dependent methyltransferase, partial [Trebonia sp.]